MSLRGFLQKHACFERGLLTNGKSGDMERRPSARRFFHYSFMYSSQPTMPSTGCRGVEEGAAQGRQIIEADPLQKVWITTMAKGKEPTRGLALGPSSMLETMLLQSTRKRARKEREIQGPE